VVTAPKTGVVLDAPPVLKASEHSVDHTCGRCATVLLHADEGQVHGILRRHRIPIQPTPALQLSAIGARTAGSIQLAAGSSPLLDSGPPPHPPLPQTAGSLSHVPSLCAGATGHRPEPGFPGLWMSNE
jgi:hypothetical protein